MQIWKWQLNDMCFNPCSGTGHGYRFSKNNCLITHILYVYNFTMVSFSMTNCLGFAMMRQKDRYRKCSDLIKSVVIADSKILFPSTIDI